MRSWWVPLLILRLHLGTGEWVRLFFATCFTVRQSYNAREGTGGEGVTVVYIDSVFVLNALMDYLLFLATARLAGLTLRRGRYVLGALCGGAYAVAVFLPGCIFLAQTPVKLAVGVLLALVVFGGEEKLLRLTLLLFAVSCALAGCILALGLLAGGGVPMANGIFYTNVNAMALLIAAASAYLLMTVIFRAAARHGVRGELTAVQISLEGRRVELTALCDTGNVLRDPVTGRQLLVASFRAVEPLWTPAMRGMFSSNLLRFPADLLGMLYKQEQAARFRLVPYHTVGIPSGLLLAVRTDWVEVAGTRYENLLVALSPTELGEGIGALWGGGEKGGEHRGKLEKQPAGTAGSTGSAASGGDSLYRWQRYTATAAEPRTRSGVVGAAGRRSCKTGTD